MKLAPGLLDALSRTRILPLVAEASLGHGERRSRAKGAGIEFVDYRPYEAGDDLRHIDLRVRGRLGINVVRQHAVHQQLSVTVILDGSASMRLGSPGKFEVAKEVAAIFAFAALAGGDRVQILTATGGRIEPSGWTGGVRQFDRLVGFLEERRTGGVFMDALARAPLHFGAPRSLAIIISDFMLDDIDRAVRLLRGKENELLLVRILDPLEADPGDFGGGAVRLLDVETGAVREIVLTADARRQYRDLMSAWTAELEGAARRSNGRFLSMLTTDDLVTLVTRQWRGGGVLL